MRRNSIFSEFPFDARVNLLLTQRVPSINIKKELSSRRNATFGLTWVSLVNFESPESTLTIHQWSVFFLPGPIQRPQMEIKPISKVSAESLTLPKFDSSISPSQLLILLNERTNKYGWEGLVTIYWFWVQSLKKLSWITYTDKNLWRPQ